ncbi:MAG: DUF2249 domain-containing protein [Candidatus Methylomirabilales bacterium]
MGRIDKGMKVSELLQHHPELVEVLARFHPHFGLLQNRLLRKIMAPRVTLEQAARIAGVDLREFLRVIGQAVGQEIEEPALETEPKEVPPIERMKPEVLKAIDPARLVPLDVREDIRAGREPFPRIMKAVQALRNDQVLVLRAPFEPIPLYGVLGTKGFAHFAEAAAPDDWTVYFYRPVFTGPQLSVFSRDEEAPRQKTEDRDLGSGAGTITLDVRGLEPPEPMVRVLEALEHLPRGATLLVLHERRPLFLYPKLEERGFEYITQEIAPGDVRIFIRHRNP